jgi:NADPH-dependent ferric siderophore reductase
MVATPLPAPEALDGRMAGLHRWTLEVQATTTPAPGVRRLLLGHPDLARLSPAPGQDLMVAVPDGAGGTTNRRYSIRASAFDADAPHVVVDVVVHGRGPGSTWASAAAAGDRVEAIGPRGQVTPVAGAAHHLFVADPSGTPASLAMLESLPADAGDLVVVAETLDDLVPHDLDVAGVAVLVGPERHRLGEVVAGLVRKGTHAYLAGERGDVARWRQLVAGSGVAADAVSAKAYWARGAANLGHGEPAREG